MKVRWTRAARRPPWPWWAVAAVGLWVALGATAVYLSRQTGVEVVLCPFRLLTGLPCPTCGLTRGALALLAGKPLRAWTFNPLLFTAIAIWLLLLLVRVAFGRAVRLDLPRRQRRTAWVALVVLIAVNWAYLFVYVG